MKMKIIRILCYSFLVVFALIGLTQLTAYGKSSEAKTVSPTGNNIYGIGSVSKMFCTAAVMELVDENKIDLDTPLIHYLPDFSMADERYKKITPKMLLDHSSGLMGATPHNGFLYGEEDTSFHDTFLTQLKNQKLKADPGEYSVYCNDGFMLAELLVERISGMSYSEYIKKELVEPLGLKSTFMPTEGVKEAMPAPVYYGNDTLPYVNCQFLGSGGIYSTAEDLCRFSQIFMQKGQRILSKASMDLMAKPWYLEDKIRSGEGDTQLGYGLGWDCVNTYPYNLYHMKALSKGGDVNGYHTGLTVLPDQNLSIAITTSGGSSTYCQEAAQDILLEVLKEEGLIDEIRDIGIKNTEKVEPAPLPENMAQYEGYYISQNLLRVTFRPDGMLLLKPVGSNYDTIQEYAYTKSGEFVSTKGYYIDSTGNLVSSANGNKGFTKLKFDKQPNGKIYLLGNLYESTSGLGEAAYTLPLAEKIEPSVIDAQTVKCWQERADKEYFLVGEAYNSSAFLDRPIMDIRLLNELPGYVSGYVNDIATKPLKITGPDTAACEMDLPGLIGRDLTDFQFDTSKQIEYLSTDSYRYERAEAVKSSLELPKEYVVPSDDAAAWYKIAKKDAGNEIIIKAPVNGAYYVYSKDNKCIASSIFQEPSSSIILPEDGYIVLTGKKDVVFTIYQQVMDTKNY